MSGSLNYWVWILRVFDLRGMSDSAKKTYLESKLSLPVLVEPIVGDLAFILRYVGERLSS